MISQLSVMLLVFVVALLPGLASRRMERSDMLTLVAVPIVMFPLAVLPGIIIWGLNKDSATYLLGMAIVVIVAALNYRFQPKKRAAGQAEQAANASTVDSAMRES
jgi:hypothetical protein